MCLLNRSSYFNPVFNLGHFLWISNDNVFWQLFQNQLDDIYFPVYSSNYQDSVDEIKIMKNFLVCLLRTNLVKDQKCVDTFLGPGHT